MQLKNAWQAGADVVVVGGGLAGLAAAADLARAGHSVIVFEKSPRLGGRAETLVHEGYAFNRGAHALYTGGAASAVLRELGVSYHASSPGAVSGLRNGHLQKLPTDPRSLISSHALNLAEKLELVRLYARLPRIDAHALAGVSVAAWLSGAVRRPGTYALLAGLARTFVYSAALDLVSAEVFVDKLQRSLSHRIHYVDGGWQTLVDGLSTVASEAGARLLSGARVEAIEQDGRRVGGVHVSRPGSAERVFVPAAAIVLATTPSEAAKLLTGPVFDGLRGEIERLVPADVACLDLALLRLPCPRHWAVQDLEQPRFLTTQSQFVHIAPTGRALVQTFKQLDPRLPADPRADEKDLEELLDVAQPGWRDLVVKRVFLPRLAGSTALPLAATGGFAGRPAARVAACENLVLAGDWVGPTGYLADASFNSARAAAALLRNSLAEHAGPSGSGGLDGLAAGEIDYEVRTFHADGIGFDQVRAADKTGGRRF